MMFVLVFLASFSSFAITLLDIQNYALENSSALKSKEMEQHALVSDAEVRAKWINPQLMGQIGSLKSGDQRGATIEMSIVQAVPLSDKYSARKELALEAARAQGLRNQFFKNWIIHQATLSTWRVFVQQKLFEHGADRTRRISIIKKYSESRPRVSVRQQVELNILSALLMNHEKLLDEKEFDLRIAQNELEYWTGRKIDPKDIDLNIPKLDPDVMGDINIERDLELLDAKVLAKTSQFEFEIAKKETRPDLFLGGGYRIENVEPVNHFSYGIIGMNIPIWDTGKERVEAAHARAMRDERNLEDSNKKIKVKQLKQVENVLFWAKQVERFSVKNLDRQERAVEVAEDGFKKGIIDVNLFLQSETQSHEAIDQIYLSWMTYLDNLSLLQLMRGEVLSWEKI